MNRKRNINYIKPDDPPFLKVLKKEAGYDDTNHKFDTLQNAKDFADDNDNELPQVVVLKKGDLTAEEVAKEREKIKHIESETKADLSQKIVFSVKPKKLDQKTHPNKQIKNKPNLLSFTDEDSFDNES